MKKNLLLFTAVFSLFLTSNFSRAEQAPEVGPIYVEVILDASNSMNEEVEGVAKIVTAKQVIASLASSLDPSIQMSLRVYGDHFDPLGTKEKACQDSALAVGFGANNREQIVAAAQSVIAKGYTPIAFSLQQAYNLDLMPIQEGSQSIILVSDGKESCGGDPCALVKELKARGVNTVIHTVGFAVDAQTRAQLECIAKETGGQYYDAKNASALQESFKQVQQQLQTMVGTKSQWSYDFQGQEIASGSNCSGAPSIGAGKYVMRNLANSPNEKLGEIKHCVLIPLKASQNLTVKAIVTGVVGADTRDDSNAFLNFGMQLWGQSDQTIHYDSKEIYKISAYKPYSEEFWLDNVSDQVYCLSFSASGWYKTSPAGFNVGFEVLITDLSDADSGKDAPETFADALAIEAKNYPNNFLTVNDVDRFKLPIPAGTLSIKIVPEETKRVKIDIYNEDRERLSGDSSSNDGAVVRFERTFNKPQTLYLELSGTSDISAWVGGQKKWAHRGGKYEMNISMQPAAAPATLTPEK